MAEIVSLWSCEQVERIVRDNYTLDIGAGQEVGEGLALAGIFAVQINTREVGAEFLNCFQRSGIERLQGQGGRVLNSRLVELASVATCNHSGSVSHKMLFADEDA